MSTALAEKTNTFFHAGHRSAGTDEAGGGHCSSPTRFCSNSISILQRAERLCCNPKKG